MSRASTASFGSAFNRVWCRKRATPTEDNLSVPVEIQVLAVVGPTDLSSDRSWTVSAPQLRVIKWDHLVSQCVCCAARI
eukprot:m.355492 g.355492  ORF g.355492 m.355492 type:complete len:79 (-) comp16597_c1_seq44:1366-1602(-)